MDYGESNSGDVKQVQAMDVSVQEKKPASLFVVMAMRRSGMVQGSQHWVSTVEAKNQIPHSVMKLHDLFRQVTIS